MTAERLAICSLLSTHTLIVSKVFKNKVTDNTVFISEPIQHSLHQWTDTDPIPCGSKTDFSSAVEWICFRSLTLGSHEGNCVLLLSPSFTIGFVSVNRFLINQRVVQISKRSRFRSLRNLKNKLKKQLNNEKIRSTCLMWVQYFRFQ